MKIDNSKRSMLKGGAIGVGCLTVAPLLTGNAKPSNKSTAGKMKCGKMTGQNLRKYYEGSTHD